MTRAQRGDHDAFARLVAGSIGRLNGTARLILRDYARAEDAVQESLVDAWRDLPGLRDPDRFDAWVNRLLVRHCLDSRRRESRIGRFELHIDAPDALEDDRQGSVANRDRVERALRRLSIDHRTVLVVAFYLDLPLAEAASTLGIPLGTMKSRLHRAMAALRAVLDADERTIQAAEGTA